MRKQFIMKMIDAYLDLHRLNEIPKRDLEKIFNQAYLSLEKANRLVVMAQRGHG